MHQNCFYGVSSVPGACFDTWMLVPLLTLPVSYICTGGKVLRYHCLNPIVC